MKKKSCKLEISMGCQRLTYHPENSPLKVVYNDLNSSGNTCLGDYRYGFQGQEKDDEIKGEGNSVNYKFRMHDPRVGRFFAPDPLIVGKGEYPWYSPYQFAGNKPIWAIDLEGLQELIYSETLGDFENLVIDVIESSDVLYQIYDRVSDVNRCNMKLHIGSIDRRDIDAPVTWGGRTISSSQTKSWAEWMVKTKAHIDETDKYNSENGTDLEYKLSSSHLAKYEKWNKIFDAAGLTAKKVYESEDDESFTIILLNKSSVGKIGNLQNKAEVLKTYFHELDAHFDDDINSGAGGGKEQHLKYFGYDNIDDPTEKEQKVIDLIESGKSPSPESYKKGSEAQKNYDAIKKAIKK